MPIQNDQYIKPTISDVKQAIEAQLRAEFGDDIDLTESSVFSNLSNAIATVLVENQEESLEQVYESAFLDTATNEDLENVVALLGLQRRPAIHSTGVQRFTASGKVTQDYVVQRGYVVQTDSNEPTRFETTQVATLRLWDDFESASLSEYDGDTGSASIVSSNAYRNTNSLELDAISGSHVFITTNELRRGSTYHAHARPQASTVPIVTFGVNPDDTSDYYQVAFDAAADEARLERVDGGSIGATIDTTSVTIDAGSYYEADIDWNITGNIGVSIRDVSGDELATLGGVDNTYKSGYVGFKSGDANAAKNFDFATMSAVSANIRALTGGPESNVGANSITTQPSPTSGVESTTNLYPTGDTSFTDLENNAFNTGTAEETDVELRERARDTATGGGAATHDAIVSALVNDIEDVQSVTLFENKTDTDNTGSGGLPPHSYEAVVFGGTDQEVAETIFDTAAVTARDYGGANGTATTVTVQSEVNGQQRDITFSRPTEVAVDITLDLVINDNYIGDDALRDRIVAYVGGTESDDSTRRGLGVGEDVLIDAIIDRVVGAEDTGVVGLDNAFDSDPVSTTPNTTTVDGLDVIEIGDTEVASTDATDGSITLNTRNP